MFVQENVQSAGMRKDGVRVNFAKHSANGIGEEAGIVGGANDQGTVSEAAEGVGKKCFRLNWFPRAKIPEITDDTYDFKISIVGRHRNSIKDVELHSAADRVFVGEIFQIGRASCRERV